VASALFFMMDLSVMLSVPQYNMMPLLLLLLFHDFGLVFGLCLLRISVYSAYRLTVFGVLEQSARLDVSGGSNGRLRKSA
jgi:hypothetical protein